MIFPDNLELVKGYRGKSWTRHRLGPLRIRSCVDTMEVAVVKIISEMFLIQIALTYQMMDITRLVQYS